MTHTRTHTHTHRENDKFPKNQERKKIFTLQILEKPYSFTFPLVPPILPSLTSSPLPLLSQCTTDRSATEANERHLMSDTAHQTSGDRLHLQLTGYSFKKILVAAVTDLAGNTHDVMYITSTKEGEVSQYSLSSLPSLL